MLDKAEIYKQAEREEHISFLRDGYSSRTAKCLVSAVELMKQMEVAMQELEARFCFIAVDEEPQVGDMVIDMGYAAAAQLFAFTLTEPNPESLSMTIEMYAGSGSPVNYYKNRNVKIVTRGGKPALIRAKKTKGDKG